MKEKLRAWLSEEYSGMESFLETEERPYISRAEEKRSEHIWEERLLHSPETQIAVQKGRKHWKTINHILAAFGYAVFILAVLYAVAHLPRFGTDNPLADTVAKRYIESGLEETGATNIVAGMILDYRAFDTLGESFVLFTALLCSMMLLRIDSKNMRPDKEDYYTVRLDRYFDTSQDTILRKIGLLTVPIILVFGIYVLLNGHLSPGGGFSGGAILGSGLIILSSALGFEAADRFFTARRLNLLSFAALGFYALSKCYVFFIGANGIHNPIPKGFPGAILSGGLILPLNIAVGLVVACTMYGFYSLFRRGNIGSG